MTGSAGASRPAVIMIVEGRVPPGGRDALESFHADAKAFFHDHRSMAIRLQWDSEDALRFRAVLEYDTEHDFEADDVRSRVDVQFMTLRSRFLSHLDGTPSVSIWRETNRQHGADLVRAYWGLLDAHEWTGLRAILADDIAMEWPAFNERVAGADAVIGAGRSAPSDWVIRVVSIVACGDHVASEVVITLEGGRSIAFSTFWLVEREKLAQATEYWSTFGRDTSPAWRRAWSMPIGP